MSKTCEGTLTTDVREEASSGLQATFADRRTIQNSCNNFMSINAAKEKKLFLCTFELWCDSLICSETTVCVLLL